MAETYDLAIIGAGPGGLTAALYASRYILNTLVVGKSAGGLIAEAHRVCNFPTHEEISGLGLSQKLTEQVKKLDVPIYYETVEKIEVHDDGFKLTTKNNIFTAKKIILAPGTEKRRLNLPEEEGFMGKGVSYCATCDGPFFKDRVVAVVGGSDAALTAALLLSEHATKVYIIYRKDHFFRGEPAWVKLAEDNPKIEPVFNSEIKEIKGANMVKSVVLNDGSELEVQGVFVEIGSDPNTKLAEELGVTLERGYIVVDKFQKTNIPGVFAVGDVTNSPLKQVVTAAASGAIAAKSAYDELVRSR